MSTMFIPWPLRGSRLRVLVTHPAKCEAVQRGWWVWGGGRWGVGNQRLRRVTVERVLLTFRYADPTGVSPCIQLNPSSSPLFIGRDIRLPARFDLQFFTSYPPASLTFTCNDNWTPSSSSSSSSSSIDSVKLCNFFFCYVKIEFMHLRSCSTCFWYSQWIQEWDRRGVLGAMARSCSWQAERCQVVTWTALRCQ